MSGQPRASILIPTHDRPESLRFAVDTALRQTVDDLEVIIIGDGLTPRARSAAESLLVGDPRVRLLDRPKSNFHGEAYRHEAILESRSNTICYLCDDDLLLPHHVEDLLHLLEQNDLVQSLNGAIDADGSLVVYPGSLDDPGNVRSIVRKDLRFNSISLTGTAHRRDTYLRLDRPWTETPEGWWPDHFQWCKMLEASNLKVSTSHRMTALQFPTSDPVRGTWTERERLEELVTWHELVRSTDGQSKVDAMVTKALSSRVSGLYHEADDLRRRSRLLEELVTEKEIALRATSEELLTRRAELESCAARMVELQEGQHRLSNDVLHVGTEIEAMRATISWRITKPLRVVRRLIRSRDT